ncbi:type II toxin-antitoxin system RelE/ParE family toxin [Mucilaginibacter polytrichastri]|uniref:Uncharacterized protein n=1 Tax=Mucilaginibacter polytrichastri TaxID=1302689 RepID=A0A1Q5ZT37_9SPHI|nr:hypothetical protein RG47T_0345 [Mucilaginibacter polytrichastri]SFS47853.1 RelE-like toxin of type II toxin-antitoxin system HigB [Mucilaginibacter polytrichastri]
MCRVYGLHSLSGDLKDFWSVKVDKNYRVIFQFIGEEAHLVDSVDYHWEGKIKMAMYDPAHPGELIRETLEGIHEETGQKTNRVAGCIGIRHHA